MPLTNAEMKAGLVSDMRSHSTLVEGYQTEMHSLSFRWNNLFLAALEGSLSQEHYDRLDGYRSRLNDIKERKFADWDEKMALLFPSNVRDDPELNAVRWQVHQLKDKVQKAIDVSMYPKEYAKYKEAKDKWTNNRPQSDAVAIGAIIDKRDALYLVRQSLNAQKERLKDVSHRNLVRLRDNIIDLVKLVQSDYHKLDPTAETFGQANSGELIEADVALSQSSSPGVRFQASGSGLRPAAVQYQRLTEGGPSTMQSAGITPPRRRS